MSDTANSSSGGDSGASRFEDWNDWQIQLHGSEDDVVDILTQIVETSLLSRLPSGLVLDAGCGSGLSSRALLKCGYDVLGIDPSDRQIADATQSLGPEFGDRARFEVANVLELPSALDGRFDGVFAVSDNLLGILDEEDLSAVFAGFARVLKPGGILAVTHQDFHRLMAEEPDVAASQPVYRDGAAGSFVLLQRRIWSGKPRDRAFDSEYVRMDLQGGRQQFTKRYRASTIAEMTEKMAGAGFDAISWTDQYQSNPSQSICVATKEPVPEDHYRLSGLERPESALSPPSESDQEPTKFQFFPEDLGRNPFEEEPGYTEGTLQHARKQDGTLVLSRRKQVTLVMFSGGIDSVYVLHRLLKESEDEIIAHHIHFLNLEGRDRAEAVACTQIVEHLKKTVRPFVYTESAIDRRRFRGFGMDDMAVAFEVGVISTSFLIDRGYGIDRWTSGTCLEEELEYYGEQEIERFEHVLNTAAASCYPNPAPRFFQLKIIPKRDQMAYMGEELTGLCWTCREPVWHGDTPRECGVCKTCLLMKKIRSGEETIPRKTRIAPSDLEL